MTISSINSLTASGQNADIQGQATAEQREVARQFEAIFLRQILSGLQKTDGHGGDSSGSQVYRSMMVDSVADSASEAGGIGLSEVILRAMLPPPLTPGVSSLSREATPDVLEAGEQGSGTQANSPNAGNIAAFRAKGAL